MAFANNLERCRAFYEECGAPLMAESCDYDYDGDSAPVRIRIAGAGGEGKLEVH